MNTIDNMLKETKKLDRELQEICEEAENEYYALNYDDEVIVSSRLKYVLKPL